MTREYIVQFANEPAENAEAVEPQETKPVDAQAEEPVEAEAKPEETEAKEEPVPEEEKPHRKSGSQRARERADRAEARAAAAEARAAAAEARLNGAAALQPTEGEPKLADFETIEDWQAALRDHVAKTVREEAEKAFKAEQAKKELEAKQNAWRDADQKFAAKQPDYDDVLEDLVDTVREIAPKHPETFQAIDIAVSDSELAPQLKYHLGKNPEELKRIVSLTPVAAIKAIAKLEDTLKEEKPPEKKTTQAPPPIEPLKGISTGVISKRRSDSYVIT